MNNDQTALAAYDPTMAALGLAEGEPLKPSNLRLLQPIETAEAEGLIAGRFLDEQSNMQFKSMQVAVLMLGNTRVCYPPGSERGEKPLCRSYDGIFPVIQDGLQRQDGGKGCAKCPMSQWKKIGGKSIKPPCMEVIRCMFAEVDTEFVYRLNAKRSNVPPVRELRQTIAKSVKYAQQKGVVVPYYGLVYELGAVKLTGKKGTYFNLKFTPTGNLLDVNQFPDGKEKLDRFAQMATYFLTRGKDAAVEEEADPVDTAFAGHSDDQGEYVAA